MKSNHKKIFSTIIVSVSYLSLLVLGACIENIDSDPFGECPTTGQKSNLIDFSVQYEPYRNNRYSISSDEVNFKDFKFNLSFTLEQLSEAKYHSIFPGQAFALSCIAVYDIRNVSNIAILLAAPFENIPTGTDVSYLFIAQNGEPLSEFRDFSKMTTILSLTLQKTPTSKTQLKTKTIVFFKNGTQKLIESTSPTILIN